MNLDPLKLQLGASKPWPFYLWNQSAALKELAQAADPKSVDVLVEAVEGNHRLAGKIREALSAMTAPVKIDRLCCLWAKSRQSWVGKIITSNQWTGQTEGVSTLCALKCGQQSGLGNDPKTISRALGYFTDKDAEVRSAVMAYAGRLPNEARANDAIYKVLVETRSEDVAQLIKKQGRVPSSINEQTAGWILKLGFEPGLGVDPQTIGLVFGHVADSDPAVRAAVMDYAKRLPDEARANDALYDLWIRTQSPEMEYLICEQQRMPSSVAKETLLRLAVGDVDGYLGMEDENGQIFREAWGIAPDALRARVTQVVTKSGNSRLIDAYTRALGGAREGLDIKTVMEARKTAGDEDGLFDASRSLGVLELLDLCARWEDSGKLPADPSMRREAENAIASFREVGKIEFEQAPALPEGLVDFFAAELESALTSPDPFLRLHAALKGKGAPDVKKLAASEDWPDRLAARLLAPELAVSGAQEHVQWTSLAGGVISNTLFATTAGGTPAEHETLLRLRESYAGKTDRVAVINRGLAGVLLAFQSHFQRGAIASQADDSAEERGAIQQAGAASEEDLNF